MSRECSGCGGSGHRAGAECAPWHSEPCSICGGTGESNVFDREDDPWIMDDIDRECRERLAKLQAMTDGEVASEYCAIINRLIFNADDRETQITQMIDQYRVYLIQGWHPPGSGRF